LKPECWGYTIGSRGEVSGERKPVIRDNVDDNGNSNKNNYNNKAEQICPIFLKMSSLFRH
jgi:hypothetical protein